MIILSTFVYYLSSTTLPDLLECIKETVIGLLGRDKDEFTLSHRVQVLYCQTHQFPEVRAPILVSNRENGWLCGENFNSLVFTHFVYLFIF